jgi:hypothetical protein
MAQHRESAAVGPDREDRPIAIRAAYVCRAVKPAVATLQEPAIGILSIA